MGYIYILPYPEGHYVFLFQLTAFGGALANRRGNSELTPQYKQFDFTIFWTYAVADQDNNIFWEKTHEVQQLAKEKELPVFSPSPPPQISLRILVHLDFNADSSNFLP